MKIIFLLLFISLTLFGYTQKDLASLYESNYTKDEYLKVKIIEDNYFVVSSSIKLGRTSNRRLTTIAKRLLFKYIKKSDKDINSLELQQFQSGLVWSTEHKNFMLSYIKKENVIKIYTSNNEIQNNTILQDEIKTLENLKDKNIQIHKQLKSLYFQNGDIDNYNKQIEIIMNLKFKGFNQ